MRHLIEDLGTALCEGQETLSLTHHLSGETGVFTWNKKKYEFWPLQAVDVIRRVTKHTLAKPHKVEAEAEKNVERGGAWYIGLRLAGGKWVKE